jgi:formiminotetrahydrofolate cyclodeaminase
MVSERARPNTRVQLQDVPAVDVRPLPNADLMTVIFSLPKKLVRRAHTSCISATGAAVAPLRIAL